MKLVKSYMDTEKHLKKTNLVPSSASYLRKSNRRRSHTSQTRPQTHLGSDSLIVSRFDSFKKCRLPNKGGKIITWLWDISTKWTNKQKTENNTPKVILPVIYSQRGCKDPYRKLKELQQVSTRTINGRRHYIDLGFLLQMFINKKELKHCRFYW